MRALTHLIIISLIMLCVSLAHAQTNLKEIEQTFSDSVITAKITAKFTKNRDLNPLKISVTTHDGIVALSGHVKDREAFVNALRLTKNTTGVKSVEIENLVIQPVNTSFTDAYITAKVEAAILKAKVFDEESIPLVGINASTTNGAVTLSGRVKNNKSIIAIVKRVNAVKGVKKIISNLEVSKES